jgi:hypothetical protein
VGSIPLKLQAAHAAKLRRVLVPTRAHEETRAEGGGQSRFTQVSPVRSVPEAFEALTDSPISR